MIFTVPSTPTSFRQQPHQSPADFLRSRGWTVGSVLHGAEVTGPAGQRMDRAMLVRVTAIGEETVLGVSQVQGLTLDTWSREHSFGFSHRDWTLITAPDVDAEQRRALRHAIGYSPVPVSITGHPDIRLVHRTAADADGLIDRILTAGFVLPTYHPTAQAA